MIGRLCDVIVVTRCVTGRRMTSEVTKAPIDDNGGVAIVIGQWDDVTVTSHLASMTSQ